MRLFSLGLVGIIAGAATISLASSASAGSRAAAVGRASSGGVAVVGGGHLQHGGLVGRAKFRTPQKPWWDAHGGPANPAGSYLGFVNGRPGRGDGWHIWLGDGHDGHGDHNGHDGYHDHHGHHHDHGHDGFNDDAFYGGYWGYDEDGDAYVDTIPLPDQFGFFATGGQVIQRDGKQPVYAYDRGYPYEWYGGRSLGAVPPPPPPGMAPHGPMAPMGPGMSSGIRCEVQSTYDEANSREAQVRVCRGW